MVRRGRSIDVDRLIDEVRLRVRDVVEQETAAHTEEIRRLLARERAESASALAAQERELLEARRAAFAEREQALAESLSESLALSERRLEERLRGFTSDLERAQRHLEQQIASLEQRRKQALVDIEHRIEAEAAELGSTADAQRRVVVRLREELEAAAGQAVTSALDDLETQVVERRRVIDELTEHMRAREAALAESVAKTEHDVRAHIDVMLVDWEKRQTQRLERVTEREIERHAQIALQAYDERLRAIREESLAALSRELDRAVDMLSRAELARRLDQ